MKQSRRRSVIKALLATALLGAWGLAFAAQVAGTVVNLSGPLMAKKADGSVKVLALRSEVEQGDTLVSEKNTYAQIKFIDNSEITLKPGTVFKIEAFAYEEGKPEADSASFDLVKGGLRSITGLLGKRSKEKFALKTPTATIGIRGTTFIVQYVMPTAPKSGSAPSAPGTPSAPGAPALPPGVYVHVTDGMISMSNNGGTQNFAAGQFGYTGTPFVPPVHVPLNPAGLNFTPPQSFMGPAQPGSDASPTQNPNVVDCVVR